jgi:hypothetical protein
MVFILNRSSAPLTRKPLIAGVTRQERNTIEMNEENNVAFCGLFCGDCIIKNAKIGQISQQVLNIIGSWKFQKLEKGLPIISSDFWKNLKYVQDAKPVLESMCNLDCVRSCKEGGGTSSCEIRFCCQAKYLNGCWECEKMDSCSVLATIFPVHQGSNIKNMKIIREKGMEAFLAGEKDW